MWAPLRLVSATMKQQPPGLHTLPPPARPETPRGKRQFGSAAHANAITAHDLGPPCQQGFSV